MRALLDTNILLDVLLNREPFVHPAAQIFALAEQSRIEGFVCATSATTVDYLLSHSMPAAEARRAVTMLLRLFDVAVVNRSVLMCALASRFSDYEDAVVNESAVVAGVEAIITRNPKDFRHSSLRILDPVEFLAQFKARQKRTTESD